MYWYVAPDALPVSATFVCVLDRWLKLKSVPWHYYYNNYYDGIIESVDSISRDGPDTPIYVMHNKTPKSSV